MNACTACGAATPTTKCAPCWALMNRRDAPCPGCRKPRLSPAEAQRGALCGACYRDEVDVRRAVAILRTAAPRAISGRCYRLTHTQVQEILARLWKRGELRLQRSTGAWEVAS